MQISTLIATLAASLLALSATGAAACTAPPGGAAVAVTAHGLKDRAGNIRVAIYRALESELLASGKYVTRIDVPVTAAGDVPVCATVPAPGDYVVTVLHDRNANGKLDVFQDGVGFSNNPRLRLAKPKVATVQVSLGAGTTPMAVEMNYLRGLSVGPVRARR
jgi:uncharacterized protein (DUF2141 family)